MTVRHVSGAPEPQRPHDRETVLQSRRQLLQAAASAAPLIATLPSGAAAATASTAQCIVNSRVRSQQTINNDFYPVSSVPPDDSFVRAPGKKYVFERRVGPILRSVTVFTINGADPVYYTQSGTVFNATGWALKSQEDVLLMRVYIPTSDTNDPIGNPTSVDNCVFVSGIQQAIPPQCIYPVGQRQKSNDEGNMGIAYSCLCSVNPSLGGPVC